MPKLWKKNYLKQTINFKTKQFMTIIKAILKWFFGILLLIFGIVGLSQEPSMSIVPILLGLFLIPKTYKSFTDKTKLNLSSGVKWIVVIVGIMLIGYTASISETSKESNYDLIVENASKKIDEGKINEALKLINDVKSKYRKKENKATELEKEIEKSKDVNFAKEILAKMTNEELTQLENEKLSKSYLTQKTLNKTFISLVKTYLPERAKIIKEIQEKEEKEKEIAEAKAEEEFNKNRKENIDKLFSPYNGKNTALERYIKYNMNDPDSYKHIVTTHSDKGDHILVITKFRAKNIYGGTVINIVSAKLDLKGNVIEILSEN